MTFGVRYRREDMDPEGTEQPPLEQRGFPTANSAVAYAASLFVQGQFRPVAVFNPATGFMLEDDALANAIAVELAQPK